jgi:hypothetical protein
MPSSASWPAESSRHQGRAAVLGELLDELGLNAADGAV